MLDDSPKQVTSHELAKMLLNLPDLPILHYETHMETGRSLQPTYAITQVVAEITTKVEKKRCFDSFDNVHYETEVLTLNKVVPDDSDDKPTNILLNL